MNRRNQAQSNQIPSARNDSKNQAHPSGKQPGGGGIPKPHQADSKASQSPSAKPEDRMLLQLNKLIADHLETAGYQKAAKAFKEDLARTSLADQKEHAYGRGKQGISSAKGQRKEPASPQELLLQIQASFDKGNKSEFFKVFNQFIPADIKKKDFSYKKLEFYLQIYFVVFIKHPNINPINLQNLKNKDIDHEFSEAQSEFKKYLDSKGSELSKANEFLAYYALPYIPNPLNHPSFKHLFTVDWVQDLKQKLKHFIQSNSQKLGLIQPGANSKLYGVYKDFSKVTGGDNPDGSNPSATNETLTDRLKVMQKNMVVLQKKEAYSKRMLYESQLKWTNFSYDVVRNCKELIMAMEQAGIQQYQLFENQKIRFLENIKVRIHRYDMFLKNNSRELNAKGYGAAGGQQPQPPPSNAQQMNNQQISIQNQQFDSHLAQQQKQNLYQGQASALTNREQQQLPMQQPQPSFFSDASSIPPLNELAGENQTLMSNDDPQRNSAGEQNYFDNSNANAIQNQQYAKQQQSARSQGHQIQIKSQQYQLPKDDAADQDANEQQEEDADLDDLQLHPNFQPLKNPPTLCPLDFAKIKDFLRKSARNPHHEVEVCATLQALSWRITKVSSQIRRQNLHSYQHFDLLEMKKGESNAIFNQLIGENGSIGSSRVTEFFVIFVNSLASEYLGRCYLLQAKDIVKTLINILFSQRDQDSSLRQNALGALQKFSLRRDAQTIMITLDVIQWIIGTLKSQLDTLSEYSLEYTTALLMNLSLRSNGKTKCEQMPQNLVLSVLSELIEHENMVVRTHVNGTLYSILTRKALKQQAQSLGMKEMLEYQMLGNSDEQLKRQIQYILNQLVSSDAPPAEPNPGEPETEQEELDNDDEDYDDDYGDEDVGEDGEDDEEEEPFEDEADILDEDPDKLHDQMKDRGMPVGEEWLTSQFLLPNEEAFSQTMTISKKMESAKEEKLNASAISYSRSRPLSPFAADNAFSLSKAGYANPGNLDRQLPSAMKQKRNTNHSGLYEQLPNAAELDPQLHHQQLTQNVVSSSSNIDFGKYNQLNHDMLFNIQSTQQPVGLAGQQQDYRNGLDQHGTAQPQMMNQQNLIQNSQFTSAIMSSNSQQTYQTYTSKEEKKQGNNIPNGAGGGRKQQPHQNNAISSNSYGSQGAGNAPGGGMPPVAPGGGQIPAGYQNNDDAGGDGRQNQQPFTESARAFMPRDKIPRTPGGKEY